ncbi:MAG TPA: type VI secretion system tube protein Hcp [Acidimicrobiales bacterium]|nr:type VI secretion system tube protein Hcp [Acidimicrobiales bacterium]
MALVDYFLKIDGIDGESADSKHKGEIEVESFSWGLNNPGNASAGGGGGAGRPASFFDAFFSAATSKATPPLFLASAAGKHLPTATLTARRGANSDGQGGVEYLKIVFADLLVTSYKEDVLGGRLHAAPDETQNMLPDGTTMDTFSINFSKVTVTYTPANADGSTGTPVSASFDVRGNKGASGGGGGSG